jgi:hypothetical protein
MVQEYLAHREGADGRAHVVKAMSSFDHWRRTCLHWAVVNAHIDTVEVLLRHGAKVIPDNMRIGTPGPGTHLIQETPLQLALRRNAPPELVAMLQQAEKDLSVV